MRRIDTRNAQERWKYGCPTTARHRSWRVTDGLFECRECGETFEELVDLATGERVHRKEFEFVGPGARTKGAFGQPVVED